MALRSLTVCRSTLILCADITWFCSVEVVYSTDTGVDLVGIEFCGIAFFVTRVPALHGPVISSNFCNSSE